MSNMTIRGLDRDLADVIRENAEKEKISMNQWVLRLLRKSTGIDANPRFQKHHDLDSLAGTWSKKEAADFEESQEAFQQIDKDIWK